MFKIQNALIKLVLISIITCSANHLLSSQIRTLNNFFVAENTNIGINNTLLFTTSYDGGIIATAKTGNKGYIIFGPKSKWIGASDYQFIDGYVTVLHSNPFVFPIGDDGNYNPIAISGASNTSAAFFSRNPSKLIDRSNKKEISKIGSTIQLTEQGYWALDGSQPTVITLMWDGKTAVNEMVERDITNLSIMGLRNGQWEIISSSVDKYAFDESKHNLVVTKQNSDFKKGTISTSTEIIPNEYDYFTIGAVKASTKYGELAVYPNPVSMDLPLSVSYELPINEQATLQVYSASGILIKEMAIKADNGVLELNDVASASGVYTVRLLLSNGNVITEKLLVIDK